MPLQTSLTDRLGLIHPVIQAPMAGGTTTPELVAAVCEAGGLGFIGAAYLNPAQITETARAVRSRTSRPFGINLFAQTPAPDPQSDATRALEILAPYHAELGLAPPAVSAPAKNQFDEQLEAVLLAGAAVFSFTFGIPSPAHLNRIKSRGLFLIGTATTVEEAIQLERARVDAVVAQGSEAGAHRGTFAADFEAAMMGTMALVPAVVDAINVPVIASGGIMDGRGLAAALALGASGVQMGTAFLTCDEASVSEAHRKAILHAREDETRITRAFSGRPARGIVNRLMIEIESAPESILPFPLQNSLTRSVRNAAARSGRPEYLSLWAGQGVRLARRQPAAQLIERIAAEADAAIHALKSTEGRRSAGAPSGRESRS